MTPAERIAAAAKEWADGPLLPHNPTCAEHELDALCPKGESIRLDRTGDTDRLVRQREVEIHGVHHDDIWLQPVDGDGDIDGADHLWVDIEDDRTGDTDRLAEPFNIELLADRLRLANAQLLAYDGDPRVRPRLEAKAEGVRLALSYISDMTREDGPDE